MQMPTNMMPRTIMKGSMFSGLLAGCCGAGAGDDEEGPVWFGILRT